MLRRFHIARLALKHSPETEQRLLSFATPTPDPQKEAAIPSPELGKRADEALKSGDITLSDRQAFHDALFGAVMPDDQQRVLEAFRPEIEKHVGRVEAPKNAKELDEVMQLTRLSIVDELNREEQDRTTLADAIRNIDTSTASDQEIQAVLTKHAPIIGRYFKTSATFDPRHAMNLLQALLFKDMERIRAREYERETGIKWSFLKADEFADLYRKLRKTPANKSERLPNAFSHGNTMYFNAESADFTDETNGSANAERAVTHEATHLALKAAETKFNIDGWTNTLRSHPDWKSLVAAVEEVFASDPEYVTDATRKNDRIVSEALAIFVTNARHPAPADLASQPTYVAQQKVCAVLQGMFDKPHTGFLDMLRKDLEGRTDRYLEARTRGKDGGKSVGALLADSSQEVKNQRMIAELAESRRIKAAGDDDIETNADEGKRQASEDLDDAQKNSKNAKTPQGLLSLKRKVDGQLTGIRNKYPAIRRKINAENSDANAKSQAIAAIDQNLEWISQQQNDLLLIERTVNRIEQAETALKNPLSVQEKKLLHAECMPDVPNPYDGLSDASSEEEIAAADAKFEANRKEILDIAHDVMTQTERIADRIAKGTEPPEEEVPHSEEAPGMMNWLRKNVWGPDSGVMWITPLNIMNIIKIYKEAIQENYRSNQTVKENKFAKEMNFYRPIQHTLNKQARSSNEKETSEFLEYIEREGFTFNDVFGPDGRGLTSGLLAQNRHNFNRAKAVLLYAADHAWLYFMDRLHGHDVYGIDYETIEGHQSFEELVAKHEAGKAHQIDHGVERVDKDPDVPPIMDAMVHELSLKNIFAVQGIMKRLQGKAKFSHSNTWMLTTLLMYIRDNAARDPTLKHCLDKGMIDNISNSTITQSAWSITWLKMHRHKIEKWKLDPNEKFGNNPATQTMERIEVLLKDAGCNFPDTDKGRLAKYEAIGMIMAGKTFNIDNAEARGRGLLKYGIKPGVSISIFQDDPVLNNYRQEFRDVTATTETEPGDTDPDYFNPKNDGSDVVLLDESQTSRILGRKSTGEWTYDSKARGFLTQLLIRCDELQKTDASAYRNFLKETREKLDYTASVVWDKGRRDIVVKDTDLDGNNLMEQLASRGLLSDSIIDELSKLRATIKTAKPIPITKSK